jgi:porin
VRHTSPFRRLGLAALVSTLSTSAFSQAEPNPTPPAPVTPSGDTPGLAPPVDSKVPSIDWLSDRGITPGLWFYGTFGKNLQGGADTNDELFDHVLDVSLTFDMEKLVGFDGGTFVISFETNGGDEFYKEIGDFGGSSDVSAPQRDQINEVYYQQQLLDDTLRIKVGKMDVNYEFAIANAAYDFINSTFYWSPTLVGMPTYPDPAFGAMIAWQPTDVCYAMAGLFDGAAQEGFRTGSLGPATLVGSPADLYLIAEAGYTPRLYRDLPGRVAVGVFHHTGTFERFDGSDADGTSGAYVVVEQAVYREAPDSEDELQGATLFARAQMADRNVATVPWSFAIGGSWLGALPGRDADVAGIGLSYNGFTNSQDADFGGDEVIIEAFYRFQICEWAFIKPDVQYIMNPGGAFEDALMIAIRFGLEF